MTGRLAHGASGSPVRPVALPPLEPGAHPVALPPMESGAQPVALPHMEPGAHLVLLEQYPSLTWSQELTQ